MLQTLLLSQNGCFASLMQMGCLGIIWWNGLLQRSVNLMRAPFIWATMLNGALFLFGSGSAGEAEEPDLGGMADSCVCVAGEHFLSRGIKTHSQTLKHAHV